MNFEIKTHLASIPGAFKYAFRDLDVELARDLAICIGIVGSAVGVAFSMAGVGLATQQACATPEVIRPAAQDTWFMPPTTLSEAEPEEPAVAEPEAKSDEEPAPRRKSRRRR